MWERRRQRPAKPPLVQLTSDELFQCPVIIMQEVGRLLFTREDAAQLRTYLLKGGFLWVDDFWGSYAWRVWEGEIRKVFPATEFPIVDVPRDHPIFHMLFDLEGVPQIPGIGSFSPAVRPNAARTAIPCTPARLPTPTAA